VAITLPDGPRDQQYEDFVSAALVTLGYFIETRLILREGTREVLELDVVASPSGSNYRQRILVEAKSGGWGFPDLFKVFGQRIYLGIDNGCVVHRDLVDPEKAPALEKVAAEINVRCCEVPADITAIINIATPCTSLSDDRKAYLLRANWYSQTAQRMALSAFRQYRKVNKGTPLIKNAREYETAIHDSFFRKNAVDRVRGLYQAYQRNPGITGGFVSELASVRGVEEKCIWNEVHDTHNQLWLQYIELLEHKARVGIIKNALDDIGADQATRDDPADSEDGWGFDFTKLMRALLPPNFKQAFKEMQKHPDFTRLPYLFQVFLEVFGGFIVDGSGDLDLLAEVTGIKDACISDTLGLINQFFPFKKRGSWFYPIKNKKGGRIICMHMVPGMLKGVGCFFRSYCRGTTDPDYESFYPGWGFLLNKWHNALYYAVESELKVAI
jgi:hypothetical protein